MTPRHVDRAAERNANKAAHKAANGFVFSTEAAAASPIDESAEVLSETRSTPPLMSASQLAANRANAQLSTGPKTAEGKAKASLNAVKTALTGRTVLLPAEDAAAYDSHIRAYQDELKPVGRHESDLVQCIADASWRLHRIPGLELAIYAQGHLQFANSLDGHDPLLHASMIELQTFLTCEKQLRNLQLQEARLHRRREKDIVALRTLQEERKEEGKRKQLEVLDAAVRQYVIARHDKKPFDPAANGFEFSIEEIKDHLGRMSSAWMDRVIASRDRSISKAA
jgi:hypothetical protein